MNKLPIPFSYSLGSAAQRYWYSVYSGGLFFFDLETTTLSFESIWPGMGHCNKKLVKKARPGG